MRIQLMCGTSDCPSCRCLLLNQSHGNESKGRIVPKENNEIFPERGGMETVRQTQEVSSSDHGGNRLRDSGPRIADPTPSLMLCTPLCQALWETL